MAKKKSICVSRSFNGMVSDPELLQVLMANYTARAAETCVLKLFKPGCQFKCVGVVLTCIENGASIQTNLLDFDADRFQKMRHLDEVVDRINKVNGRETIVLGVQQYPGKGASGKSPKFEEAMKCDFKSPCYTIRWSEIVELK